MTKKLHLGEDFAPPIELMIQKTAVLARTGAGKTNVVAVVTEEVLDQKQQVVALDPKGDLWGLRSSADGKAAGYPITILGGDHGDLPLEATAGAVIADVAAEGASLILDLSSFSNAERDRFVTDFAERFYRAKAQHVGPVLFVIDEADELVPQRFSEGRARLVGAIERIVKRGRFRGIGTLLVTQRSASLNKDVLTQTEVLVVMQTTSPQDRKAIDAWVEEHPDQEKRAELLAGMAALKKGEAFVWSPTFLETFRRVRFRMRRTYDAGRDVKIGELRAAPKVLAPVDLAALGERMRATIERAKAEDPKALRGEIARLQRELRHVNAEANAKVAPPQPKPVEKRVEIPVLKDGQLARAEKVVDRLVAGLDHFAAWHHTTAAELGDVLAPITSALSAVSSSARSPGSATAPRGAGGTARHDGTAVRAGGKPAPGLAPRVSSPSRVSPDVIASPARTTSEGGAPKRYLQKVLDAMASLEALGYAAPTNLQIATWSKMSVRGGAFGSYMRELAAARLVEKDGADPKDVARLTADGRAAARANAGLTTAELHSLAHAIAKPYLHKVLDPLLVAYPADLDLEDLAARAGMSTAGGAFGSYLRELRALGFINVGKAAARAADVLFLDDRS